jgi:hypothetical protein
MKRGLVLFCAALAGILVLSTGCTGAAEPDPGPTTPPVVVGSPTPDTAKADLVAALEKSEAAPFRYVVDGDLPEGQRVKATGVVDRTARRFQSSVTITGGKDPAAARNIVIGDDSYVREAGKGWVHVDLARVRPDHPFITFDWADPTGLKAFTTAIVSAERTGPRTYTGRLDPASGLRDVFLPVGSPGIVTLGMSVAPYTVTIDAKGWVTSIAVELTPSDGPELAMTTTLSAHGKALTVKRPAGAAEAADYIYD